MKQFLPKMVVLLFLIFTFASSTKSTNRKTKIRPQSTFSKLTKELKKAQPKTSSKKYSTKNIQRKLEINSSPVSSFSTGEHKQTTNSRVFTQAQLSISLENFGHQAWEVANDLRELTHYSDDPNKNQQTTKMTSGIELKLKEGTNAIKEANTILKFYIDHFILTEDVLSKYEGYIETHSNEASSTNGVLKFMIHEFRDIHLRRFERDFFEKVKMYNSVIKDKFIPLIFLSRSDKHVGIINVLVLKLLNAERLIIFIKKYMAFVTKLKRGFHLLDYEKGNSLFNDPDIDPSIDRVKIVSNEQFERSKTNQAKHKSYVPVTILLGNEEFGSVASQSKKFPSDYLENKEEIKNSRFEDITSDAIEQVQSTTKNIHTNALISNNKVTDPFGDNLQDENNRGSLVSMRIPAKKLLQSESKDNGSSHKIVSPLDLEKDEFIKSKMEEVERMYFSKQTNSPVLKKKLDDEIILSNQSLPIESMNGEIQIDKSIIEENKTAPSLIKQPVKEMGASPIPDKSSNIDRPLPFEQLNNVIETNSQKLIELDSHGLPINLEIHRVPAIIRMDERYQDPWVSNGKVRNGISGKIAQIENKAIDADFKNQKLSPAIEQIPMRRFIYNPNAVNGGLKPANKNPIDEQVQEIDRLINDNDTFDEKKLKQLDQMFGSRMPRKLWSEDLGKVYSKMIKRGLI